MNSDGEQNSDCGSLAQGVPPNQPVSQEIRGRICVERYDLLNPKVQLWGDAAVLTYNFVGYAQGQAH